MGINSVCSAGPAGVRVTDTGEMRAVPWKNLDPPQQASHVQGRLPTELMQFRVQRVAEEVSLGWGQASGFQGCDRTWPCPDAPQSWSGE